MAYHILIWTFIALAHLGSTSPVNVTQDDGGRWDITPPIVARLDIGNQKGMGDFIGWSVVALFIATTIGLITWAIIRARRHKKEKYGNQQEQPIQMENRSTGAQGAVENV
ncbi:hypothetical protein BR93DRAFT_963311 [Coniochaeta sp. PMI_546]|nr:hypothetical protein BR93DRAFT_963311 [Coniochaeta sp. PMI_546]